MRAYSTLNTTNVVASVLGTALAGLLVGTYGLYWPALVFDSLTFTASFALFLSISKMPDEVENEAVDWNAASSGLSIVRRNRLLVTALVFGISLTTALEFYNVLYVPLISQVLRAEPIWFSIVESVQAVAIVIAGALIARNKALHAQPLAVAVLFSLLMGAAVLSMGLVKSIYLFLVSIFVMGIAEIPLSSSMQTLIQRQLADNTRARVAATINAGVALAEIIGLLVCLFLIRITSVGNIFIISGATIIGVTLLVMLSREKQPSR